MYKLGRFFGVLLLIVVILLGSMIGLLSATEYQPADVEAVEVRSGAKKTLSAGDSLTVLTWNIGYGALGDNADFFMDGGKGVYTADTARIRSNLNGIISHVDPLTPDVIFFQETDQSSFRTYLTDEVSIFKNEFGSFDAAYANNFNVLFLPYPIPPIGKVDSGLLTFSAYPVASAERVQLPIPFKWPIRLANLKRCVLIERIPIAGTERQLVIVNLHLEAYDDGEGKVAQTQMLKEILNKEAQNGNYVIAGGDFNQIFSNVDTNAYPAQEGKWQAGEIPAEDFTAIGWQLLMDARVPTCRSLDQPYAGADHESFQYYMIDGFIVTPNLRVDLLETQDYGFVNSDHNPVLMKVTLG
ncbi:MAG: endonuclease [Clostridia bacterium]|nr:endonuclease [Clostridia bacterium]MBR5428019.1 endonuclease [Clostridia bacterium]